MLILNKVNIDSLNLLSDFYKNNGDLDIYEYLQSHETIIKQKSKNIEKDDIQNTPNTVIVETTRGFIDLFLGFISDIPIIKIDLLYKLDDNNYQYIQTDYPQYKNIDIVDINDDTNILQILSKNIKKNNTNAYILSEPFALNLYRNICYKLYFDKNIDITNNNLYDVGIFITYTQYRKCIIELGYQNTI